ncbi:hypothetical protein P4571_07745 [Niallia alba]|uniref:hypothetical protein n=1 Tax=Niallia alba TaxID=2729105 RepID=UPI002E21B2C7|nr:hypothetical protein [Niallia alba]
MKDYSNYHNINTNDKIHRDGMTLLEHSLNGFESYEAFVDSYPTPIRVLIYQKYDSDSETKRVIGHIADIERGNILNINKQDWLVVTIPEDNKIYRKADMKICNSFFPAITDKTRVLIGRDDDGRPVYEEVEQKVNVPCIVEPSISINTDKVDQLLLPKGSIKISLKYAKYMNINSNDKFEMYGNRYEIEDIDYSKVINEIGIMVIYAKKDVKES